MLVSHRRGKKESSTYKKTDNGWGEGEGNVELIGLQRLAAYAGEATKLLPSGGKNSANICPVI
jgi:hypothetical protein